MVAYSHELFGNPPSWSNQVRSEVKAFSNTNSFSKHGFSEKGKGVSDHWSSVESPVCGVAYGLPYRLDRLAVLGNSVVPIVAAIALKRVLFLDQLLKNQ